MNFKKKKEDEKQNYSKLCYSDGFFSFFLRHGDN